ncbi:MAG: nucleotidyltransferase family protein [Candidatus Coproplasma sp.]
MKNIIKTISECVNYELHTDDIGKSNGQSSFILPDNSESFLSSLFEISKKHDIAHLVGDALIKNGLIENGDIKSQFQNQIFMSVYRYEKLNYEFGRICETLEKAEIPYVPLKGAVMRNYYTEPWMRTSCDIDILVIEKDLQKAADVLIEKLNYISEREEKGSHDLQIYSTSGVHLELHYTLIEEGSLLNTDKVLSNIWNYTEGKKGTYQKSFSDEAFYFYHIAHMAKHFVEGGCGIKPFVDLWILNHSSKIKFDKEKRNKLLSEGGLSKFALNAEKLSEIWFGEAEYTETTKKMEIYILQGGVYGTMHNRVFVQQIKKGGKFKYVISRIWLPYDTIKYNYPILQKHKWLLPFYQIRRWLKSLFNGKLKSGVNELSANNSVTQEQQEEISCFLYDLGLN